MPTYFIFAAQFDKKTCIVGEMPPAFEDKGWRVRKGIRMDQRHPPDTVLTMDEGHKGLVVPDMVNNIIGMCIVSKRLKELLERESGASVEYLPVSIANHKGRIAATDCFLVNVLDQVDCIDLARSDVDQHGPKPGLLSGLHRLHIFEDKVPPESKLFRLQAMPEAILIRDDLRAAIEAAGMTGSKFVAMGERHDIY
ncbi:MAG TPA: DUF1629 domain-containing protein [Polyangia bacterium]